MTEKITSLLFCVAGEKVQAVVVVRETGIKGEDFVYIKPKVNAKRVSKILISRFLRKC